MKKIALRYWQLLGWVKDLHKMVQDAIMDVGGGYYIILA